MTSPDVSVIIPVYNSVGYVGEAIRSVLDQTIAPERVELVIVDDGSTDGSDALIGRIAAQDPRLKVLTQQNSGTPGGARNPALDVAQGTFVFFLDSDDLLTPEALGRMVDVAIAEESDVVLGKIASPNNRRVPTSMFKRTVLDADLVEDKVFNTLGPTKLIRRDLIERLNLRFPEDQKVGEDQPFMAAAYLNARKISILSDMDYYVTQHRDDGSNITFSKQDSAAHAEVAVRLSRVVEQYTEPGDLRDAVLRRPYDWSLPRVLDARWNSMGDDEQAALASYLQSSIGHLYTEGVRAALRPETRAKIDLLMSGNLEGLKAYIAYSASKAVPRVEWSDGAFRLQLPAEMARVIPKEQRTVSAPKVTCRLEDVSVAGRIVRISASVRIAGLVGAPDYVGIRARLRAEELVHDFETTVSEVGPSPEQLLVESEREGFPRGVWDLYVVLRFGELEQELRIGAQRARVIEPEGVNNLKENPTPRDRIIAYFTQGAGNLSIDVGAVLHKQLARAQALGLSLDENGRAVLLVQTTRELRRQDEFFGYLKGGRHGERILLPSVRFGERATGVRLPLTAQMIGTSLTVVSVLGGVQAPLRISGTEFWPARASGFDLVPTAEGGVTVVSPRAHGRHRQRAQGDFAVTPKSVPKWISMVRDRIANSVRAVPVLGPGIGRVVRKLRGGRA